MKKRSSSRLKSRFKARLVEIQQELQLLIKNNPTLPLPNNRPKDLEVSITWDTAQTDIDLWVTEPSGEKCGHNHQVTRSGGRLIQDITSGSEPEKYTLHRALPGKYKIELEKYAHRNSPDGTPTKVKVTLTFHKGRKNQRREVFYLTLHKVGETKTLTTVTWPSPSSEKRSK